MPRRFYTLDVFTDAALAGNPLAVVLDAVGLDDAAMQRIAREFNLSETVFVREPENPVNTRGGAHFHALARTSVRWPSDGRDRGAACASARARPARHAGFARRARGEDRRGGLRRASPAAARRWPPISRCRGCPSVSATRRRRRRSPTDLGLEPADIGFRNHVPSLYGAGTPNLFVPVATLDAMARAKPDRKLWGADGGPAVYLYCPEVARAGSRLSRAHVRERLGRLRGSGDRQRRGGFRGRRHGFRRAAPTASACSSSSRALRWAGPASSRSGSKSRAGRYVRRQSADRR